MISAARSETNALIHMKEVLDIRKHITGLQRVLKKNISGRSIYFQEPNICLAVDNPTLLRPPGMKKSNRHHVLENVTLFRRPGFQT